MFGQRTELFEYSKVLGNPQFTLLPFQPYKLIYAHMLAEVGKVTESLKYVNKVYDLTVLFNFWSLSIMNIIQVLSSSI